MLLCTSVCHARPVSDAEKAVQEWMAAYRAAGIPAKDKCQALDVDVDNQRQIITVTADNVFASQIFTADVVSNIYTSLQEALGPQYETYKLRIRTKHYPIEHLVPFAQMQNVRRSFKADYTGTPWVKNTSRAYTFRHGLQNRHLSVWASHGIYWKAQKKRWEWQRPFLFTTAEDMLTPGIVNELLIPMLEKAGAVVFTPRERDWQKHEAIADNNLRGYAEYNDFKEHWQDAGTGFGCRPDKILRQGDNPFAMGTARSCATTRHDSRTARAVWTPDVPADGEYAVYVSYKTLPKSVTDARYTVRHAGVETTFRVNQRMGGGTWVYLGKFFFSKGQPDDNCITLTNVSDNDGVVSADAVRIGGGMGNIDRGGGTSGLSRYFEGARYSMQWAGMPQSVYSDKGADYGDDINVRSLASNHLSGGSIYNPKQNGLNVPLELTLAVHTDAGRTDGSVHGTLGVNMTTHDDGKVAEGASRLTSHDMAEVIMSQIYSDIQTSFGQWNLRQLWDRNYSECRLPQLPSMILETLSHQSLPDMRFMHDPTFKFTLARAIYKGVLRYLSQVHGQKEPVVQPLPVDRMQAVANTRKQAITVKWQPVADPLEPSAKAAGYVVYTRKGNNDFDNGTYTSVPEFMITAEPGVLYSFKVAAVNAGGEGFTGETVCAMVGNRGAKSNILIIDGFQRLAGPMHVTGGFDILSDPGVSYIGTPSICGPQTDFSDELLEVNSEGTLAGRIVAGNARNVAAIHGQALCRATGISISSCTRSAVESGDIRLNGYRMVDVAMGLQRADGYSLVQTPVFTPTLTRELAACTAAGTSVLVSGAYIGQAESTEGKKTNVAKASVSDILKFSHTTTVTADELSGVSGMNMSCTLFQPFDTRGLGVPSADVIYPTGGAFSCMLYEPSHHPAAIAYAGGDYKVMALGFPFESIADADLRCQIMYGIINFLLK